MSSYQLNRFLFDLKMNEPTLKQARADLSAAMPKRLSQLGAHGMLAIWIMRLDPEFQTNTYWTQK